MPHTCVNLVAVIVVYLWLGGSVVVKGERDGVQQLSHW